MSKEHAYAYEAGYRDGSINYELEHCPACKNVADLQEALAENAKLREQVDAAHMSRLLTENENDKLRELVRDMWLQLLNAYDRKELDGFTDRMRELEVDACPNCGAKVVDPTTNYVDVEVEQ